MRIPETFRLRVRSGIPFLSGGPRADDSEANEVARHQVALPPPPDAVAKNIVYPLTVGGRFGEIAVTLGLLTQTQVNELLRVQGKQLAKGERKSIGDLAIEATMLRREDVDRVLSEQRAVIYVDARSRGAPEFLTWMTDVRALVPSASVISAAAQQLQEMKQEHSQLISRDTTDQPNLKIAHTLYENCAKANATDLHLLIHENHAEVQVRINGDLWRVDNTEMRMTKTEGTQLARAMYIGAAKTNEGSFVPSEFQDAQIKGDWLPGTGLSSIRIIRGPAYPVDDGAGFLIARLQSSVLRHGDAAPEHSLHLSAPARPEGAVEFKGFTEGQKEMLEQIVRLPGGIFISTGPVNTGKSTLLYWLMWRHAQLFPHKRQITFENPPEYPKPWALILDAKGHKFAYLLEESLRMDPDLLLIGEWRNAEECLMTIQASLAGRFCLTTAHVEDPYETFLRMETLDNERLNKEVICNDSIVKALMAQRLVQRLCPECKQPLASSNGTLHEVPKYIREAIASWQGHSSGQLSEVCVRGKGCPACNHTGVVGRLPVAEIIMTSEALMDDIKRKGTGVARTNHRLRPGSDRSMLAHAIDRVLAGEVDPIDAHVAVGLKQWRDGA
ncbi:ATPase, T2SS/T4P/T4SS family [Caballeronia sp. LjRoot31]|jgi:type II secretory ATPase GspE/PulE/Tfp pilus assembly ATPase PilB-like protein|uniref:ATPase, T2SS/T4P/T4SS family n=1 Tax=Caballeronia sp. LjRoot31 TaxID=3342324 RepID=UPI003ECF0730